ncbi:hypothetical protein HDU79_007998 [Rhizoclosmatium sp. JEL0117]|nr:hypothetical protein HDU79_007998 [Rhizoclosmatium sp. JEL0117]
MLNPTQDAIHPHMIIEALSEQTLYIPPYTPRRGSEAADNLKLTIADFLPPQPPRPNKVPLPDWSFWVVKVLCTPVGGAFADAIDAAFQGQDGNSSRAEGITCGIMLSFLVFALVLQFRLSTYVPMVYWIVVILMSIVGTLITDSLVNILDVMKWQTTVGFGLALIIVFIGWYATEKTLSIQAINTTIREAFYWLAVLFTFALGTSIGNEMTVDLLQNTYWESVLVCSGIIGVVVGCFYGLKGAVDLGVPIFWVVFVMTSPLGTSFGDLLARDTSEGGAGFGIVSTSVLFVGVISVLIAFMHYEESKKALSLAKEQNLADNSQI